MLIKKLLLGLTIVTGLTVNASSAFAEYPERPIRLIIPYGQGGATDTIGRMLAGPLEETLGQPIIVTNQAGAGGAVGLAATFQSRPDGYTIAIGSDSSLSARPLMTESGYTIDSIAPIARAVQSPMTFVVRADSEIDDLDELVAANSDGNMTWSSPGVGSGPHLGAEGFFHTQGMTAQHVTSASAGEALVKLLAGEVDMISVVGSNVVGMLGDPETPIKILGVAEPERWSRLPDSPTFVEQGYDYSRPVWFGFVAPVGTPQEVIDKLAAAIEHALTDATSAELLENFHMTAAYQGPEEFGQQIAAEAEEFGTVLKAIGMAKED